MFTDADIILYRSLQISTKTDIYLHAFITLARSTDIRQKSHSLAIYVKLYTLSYIR